MLMIQLWSPAVCGCHLHEAIDDALPRSLRVPTYKTAIDAEFLVGLRRAARPTTTNSSPQPPARLCPSHQSLGHNETMYLAVRADNRLLERVMNEVVTPAGHDVNNMTWVLTLARVLEFTVPGLNTPRRNALQTQCDSLFGADKVVVV